MARADGWTPPTMASIQGIDGATSVRCVCGRTVRADMLYDYEPVPGPERPRRLSAAGRSSRYACDACRAADHRSGRLPKDRYLTHLGAPADLVARAHAHRGGQR